MKQGEELTVRMFFDSHVHFRNIGEMMLFVALYTIRQCSGAIAMPNTIPIIDSIDMAREYKGEIDILSHKENKVFDPHIALHLTDNTDVKELRKGYKERVWIIGKLYPKGATTNSENGVTDIKNVYPAFEEMQKIGMPASLHGEVVGKGISYYDRERMFVEQILPPIRRDFPELNIIMEHVSTKEAVDFVIREKNTYGTVTAHHLMKDKTVHEGYDGEFNPFYFCLPVLNSVEDRLAIRKAVTSEDENVRNNFKGITDSAPHLIEDKLIGKPGIFVPFATELFAQVFEEENALDERLDDFLAVNLMKKVYGIRPTEGLYTTLVKEEWIVPEKYSGIRPFMAEETLQWKIKSQTRR